MWWLAALFVCHCLSSTTLRYVFPSKRHGGRILLCLKTPILWHDYFPTGDFCLTHMYVWDCVYLRLITKACVSLGISECAYLYVCESVNVCVQLPGAGFIESRRFSDKHTSTDKILQRRTRCHGRCRENNQRSSEVERRKARRRGERTKQHERKINDRCLRRFSVALAKTGNGIMQRRRNSTFLGKD